MKMKDVIVQTGLTDRAVRLYIAQELVRPSGTENYNGRRSFDFSEADVVRLQQIALLRRADFSLSQIRRMLSDASAVMPVLCEHIAQEEAAVQQKTDVLKALRTLPAEDSLTVEKLCAHIRTAASAHAVPEEDMHAKAYAMRERRSYRRFGAGLLILVGVALVLIPVFWRVYYRYWTASDGYMPTVLLLYRGWIWLAGIGGVLLALNRRKSAPSTRKTKASEIFVLLSFPVAFLSLLTALLAYGFLAPFFYSQTDDPRDYGAPDRAVTQHYLSQALPDGLPDAVFPDEIPAAARLSEDAFPQAFPASTRYHYFYIDCIDAQIDMAAQWTLPQADYVKAKSDVPKAAHTVKKGDWTCLYYADTEQTQEHDYTFLIFAYNDSTCTVRYILSYAEKASVCTPYFSQMDW